MTMPIFAKDRFRCLFIHIPKTGGTSVEDAMRRLGWSESLIVHAAVDQLHHFKITPQHYHAELLDQILQWDAIDLTFSLCRHPFDRMKSEYYWQLDVGFAKDVSPHAWFGNVVEQFARDPCAFDNHLRPQVEFIPRDRACELLRLEDNGVRRALELADRLSPAGWFKRRSGSVFSIWRQKSRPSKAVEDAFSDLRLRIEDFYSVDMAYFKY